MGGAKRDLTAPAAVDDLWNRRFLRPIRYPPTQEAADKLMPPDLARSVRSADSRVALAVGT